MKKIFSIIGGIVFVFGSGTVAAFFPESIQPVVTLFCVCIGSVLISLFVIEEEKVRISRDELVESLKKEIRIVHEKIASIPTWNQVEGIFNDKKDVLNNIKVELESINEIENNNVKTLSENIRTYQDMIQEVIIQTGELIKNENTKNIQNLIDALNGNGIKIAEMLDEDSKNVISIIKNECNLIDKNTEKMTSDLKNVHLGILKQIEILEKGLLNIEKLNDMPNRVYQLYDELNDQLITYADDNRTQLKYLCEDLEESNKFFNEKMKSNIREIVDAIENYTDRVSVEIENLAQQYSVFKEYNEEIIKKMTLMSDNDYKLLKGLFDAREKKRG